jgi:hypothetical protein
MIYVLKNDVSPQHYVEPLPSFEKFEGISDGFGELDEKA